MQNQPEPPIAVDPLDFIPVPRRTRRADGWTPECQRGFIQALAATGTVRRAAAAVGKAAFGADQLRKAEGSESFAAAWDRALERFAETKAARLAAGLGAVRAEEAAWQPAPGPWQGSAARAALHPSPAAAVQDQAAVEEANWEWFMDFARRYANKVFQERQARMKGEIVAADYYLRQLTWLEVAVDCLGGDMLRLLTEWRSGDYSLVDIAETPRSRVLGEIRRDVWAEAGDPPRPEHPPRRFLVEEDGFSIEPLEYCGGGQEGSFHEQIARFDEQHRRDALAQLEWERQAYEDWERRAAEASEAGA